MIKLQEVFVVLSLLTKLTGAEVLLEIETATTVRFEGLEGKQYQVFSATNSAHIWQPIGTPQIGTGSTITFFHTTSNDQNLFFKVEEMPSPSPSNPGTPLVLLQRARLNLDGQDLSGLTLTNLDLNNFSFANARFDGADLRKAKLNGARLAGGSFKNANLQGADLSDARGPGVDFSGTDLRGAKLASGLGEKFVGTNLEGTEVTGFLDFYGDFTGATMRGIKAPGVRLGFQNVNGLDFTGSDFSNSLLAAGTSFVGANLTRVKFNNATFSYNFGTPGQPVPEEFRVRIDGANLTEADLTGVVGFYEGPGIIFHNTKMPDGSIRNQ